MIVFPYNFLDLSEAAEANVLEIEALEVEVVEALQVVVILDVSASASEVELF